MRRYARELYAALVELPNQSRTIVLDSPSSGNGSTCVAPSSRVARAWRRYVTYPRSLRHRQVLVFHLVDHGYAHAIRTLDPARTVVTCHDLIPLLAAEGVIRMPVSATVARTFRWRIAHLRRARAVIAVSDATKATLERHAGVPADRIAVIPQGVSPIFKPARDTGQATRAAAGLSGRTAVLLQVASRVRYKNTPAALHALAHLRAALGDGVVLVRVGSPMFPDEADLAAGLGVLNAVHEIGSVDDETLVAWYNAADALVFPSLWEGFGWPPLEAMACGTPVVASDTPAVAEVVGDAGILVPPDDAAALAASVERVLADRPLAKSLTRKGLARAREFTWGRTAAATMTVYERLLQ
jgi:glycosyltransferase involved in cell wall biosynthesis